MLICTCPVDEDCPALCSNVECFPWCEYLHEDGVIALEDVVDIEAQTAKNNAAMRSVIDFIMMDGDNNAQND